VNLKTAAQPMLVLLTVVLIPKFSKFLVTPNHRTREAGVSMGEGPQFPARFTGKGQSKAPGAPTL
jgi:hypothetical protein